jgi:hypothetical protein
MPGLIFRCKLCGEVLLRTSDIPREEMDSLMRGLARIREGIEEGGVSTDEINSFIEASLKGTLPLVLLSTHLPERHPEPWQEYMEKLEAAIGAQRELAKLVQVEAEE